MRNIASEEPIRSRYSAQNNSEQLLFPKSGVCHDKTRILPLLIAVSVSQLAANSARQSASEALMKLLLVSEGSEAIET